MRLLVPDSVPDPQIRPLNAFELSAAAGHAALRGCSRLGVGRDHFGFRSVSPLRIVLGDSGFWELRRLVPVINPASAEPFPKQVATELAHAQRAFHAWNIKTFQS
jgi:hypothetical protein